MGSGATGERTGSTSWRHSATGEGTDSIHQGGRRTGRGRATQKEAALEQVLPDFGREQFFPDLGSEQMPEPKTTATQPEGRQELQPELRSGSAQSTPPEDGLEKSMMQQWLRWLSELVSGVVDQLDEEEKRREYLTRTTTQELVSLRTQIQELYEELTKARERVAETATTGQLA